MNDLNGLDWSAKQSNGQKSGNYSAFNALRPTPPASGRVSPLPAVPPPNAASKSSTPANDSFSNLVTFSSGGASKNLSLQDQQKKLAELKAQQNNSPGKSLENQYAGADDSFWNNLGSGRNTPANRETASVAPNVAKANDEDLFAAFDAQTVVAIPSTAADSKSEPTKPAAWLPDDDDDDPFGLSQLQTQKTSQGPTQVSKAGRTELPPDDGDDDVLGLLGRPVSEFQKPQDEGRSKRTEKPSIHPQDKAVAELVEMGFPIEKAKEALESTESGLDVQAAVGWLLNQAHSQARAQSRNTSGTRGTDEARSSRPRQHPEDVVPSTRREKASTPTNDPAQAASEFSTAFLKTAGSLWKQGQKKLQQAVHEFNSDSESSQQPKWLRDSSPAARPNVSKPQKRENESAEIDSRNRNMPEGKQDSTVTDEALMLEAQRPDKPRPPQKVRPEARYDSSRDTSRDHSPVVPSRLRNEDPLRPSSSHFRPQAPPSRNALSRQAADDQAAQAYVSSARRRKPAQTPQEDLDIFQRPAKAPTVSQPASRPSSVVSPHPTKPAIKPISIQVRPAAPSRNIPTVSSISLKACHVDREAGNEHFKRGDYGSAHESYSRSLTHLPQSHPIAIILLTNRALTAIKTGEPKVAVTDADMAISIIGPAKGESETIDLSNGSTPKPMREYYGKALIRKAEALEHMEKWSEATMVWREAVENGHGGASAIQGRQRAENAAKSKTTPTVAVAVKKPAPPRPAAKSAAVARAGARAEKAAVDKLRAQNAAADKLDDERFQLSDTVDAKINGWRGGKQDNLRALLGSLDTVLWSEAGWKKISMADLVLPNKVKIQYMKGIAKVHPDKIPTTATTEQRMIAGAVFSTLNEAWDKFKKENNL